MGKKSKKYKDEWDLTPEEQAEQAEKLYELERGNIDITALTDDKPIIRDSGLTPEIEKLVLNDIRTDSKFVTSVDVQPKEMKTNMEKLEDEFSYSQQFVDKVVKNKGITHDPNYMSSRKITFDTRMAQDLYRMIIDDKISPTPYSLTVGLEQGITGEYDEDDVADKVSVLYDYIITLKHPVAIYTKSEFMDSEKYKFSRVRDDQYNKRRYAFVESGNFVFCYIIDEKSYNDFLMLLNDNEYDQYDILKTYVSIAYAVGSTMQAFFIEDEWYVKEFMNSKWNLQEKFHHIFTRDNQTLFIHDEEEPRDEDGIYLENVEKLHVEARAIISEVTGESYFDDEDEDLEDEFDDDDYEDGEDDITVEITEEVTPVKTEKTTTQTVTKLEVTETKVIEETIEDDDDDIDDLLSDEMETVEDEPITKVPVTDDDEFKVQVVRRK